MTTRYAISWIIVLLFPSLVLAQPDPNQSEERLEKIASIRSAIAKQLQKLKAEPKNEIAKSNLRELYLKLGQEEFWNQEIRTTYSRAKFDPAKWDLDLLDEDLQSKRKVDWPTKAALSNFPSPVPKYPAFGGAISSVDFEVSGKIIVGAMVAWQKTRDNEYLASDPAHNLISYFNLYVLTDQPDSFFSSETAIEGKQ